MAWLSEAALEQIVLDQSDALGEATLESIRRTDWRCRRRERIWGLTVQRKSHQVEGE